MTGRRIVEFHYHIERVWERPIEYWRDGGIVLDAAFSLITGEAARDLEGNALRLRERVKGSGVDQTTANTINSSYFSSAAQRLDMVTEIYRRLDMLLEDSTTYQHVLEQGERKGEEQVNAAAGHKEVRPAEPRDCCGTSGNNRYRATCATGRADS